MNGGARLQLQRRPSSKRNLPMGEGSVAELGDFGADAVEARGEGHVHELRLSVHLEATQDSVVNFVVDGELLAFVLGVGLQGAGHLFLLVLREGHSGDDRDFLLLVELLVQLLVLLSDVGEAVETLVLSQDGQETDGRRAERSNFLEGSEHLGHLYGANATVLGEQTEAVAVGVDFSEEVHVLVDFVQMRVLGGSDEKNTCVAALNGVFLRRRFVVRGRINLFDVADAERGKQGLVKRSKGLSSLRGGLGSGLFGRGLLGGGLSSGDRLGLLDGLLGGGILVVLLGEEADGGVVEGRGLGGGHESSLLEGLE